MLCVEATSRAAGTHQTVISARFAASKNGQQSIRTYSKIMKKGRSKLRSLGAQQHGRLTAKITHLARLKSPHLTYPLVCVCLRVRVCVQLCEEYAERQTAVAKSVSYIIIWLLVLLLLGFFFSYHAYCHHHHRRHRHCNIFSSSSPSTVCVDYMDLSCVWPNVLGGFLLFCKSSSFTSTFCCHK